MPTHNLLREAHLPDDESSRQIQAIFGPGDWLADDTQQFTDNRIVTGRVVQVSDVAVRLDVGFKSDGEVPLREWYDDAAGAVVPPRPGDVVELMLLSVDGADGAVVLSYRRAQRKAAWERFVAAHKDGDVVTARVYRRVPGGLAVGADGVTAFLPASQVEMRRPPDLGVYVGRDVECVILKIDVARHNVVLSRRALLERHNAPRRANLLATIEPGQVRQGVVKNVAEFGAFVDLGGIDGLLHVSDMSWGRVANVRDVVRVDQPLEVFVLSVDRQKEKIALSLKHLTPNPWVDVGMKYPEGSRHKGEVVNVMSYGAFVKLEPGVEGLVHISDMSWTRRISHPGELLSVGDRIEVQVLRFDQEKHELSLGIKHLTANPWDGVTERYPPGMVVAGVVSNLTNYGAFVDLEDGLFGLIHVADMSWTRRGSHPGDFVQKGDAVTCLVLKVDAERHRIMLGLKQLTGDDPWHGVADRYAPGGVVKGKVVKLTEIGAFVELEPGVDGLLHVSELAEAPEGLAVGGEVEVEVLRVDAGERKIGLGLERLAGA